MDPKKEKNEWSQFGKKKEVLLAKVSCLQAWDGRRMENSFSYAVIIGGLGN